MKKRVLFLGCNKMQIPYLREIKKLGYFVVATDINEFAPGKNFVDSESRERFRL